MGIGQGAVLTALWDLSALVRLLATPGAPVLATEVARYICSRALVRYRFQGDGRSCHFTTGKAPLSPGPSMVPKLFANRILHFESSFHVSKHQREQTDAKLGNLYSNPSD